MKRKVVLYIAMSLNGYITDEIYECRLYLKKNGNKAEYKQMTARCSRYSDMFEALLGNFIKLRKMENNLRYGS